MIFKPVTGFLQILLCALIAGGTIGTQADAQTNEQPQGESSAQKTLSPYFFVKTDSEAGEVLPLRSTRAEVDIAGVIADVRVTQVYQNRGPKPIEATYVFPGSIRAAVYGMKMVVGDRVRIAQIKKKAEARKDFEDAVRTGKSATLLEQHRPNVFKMEVANIMPGDEIKVELSYTELLVPNEGVYDFVYPTVVGPRYSNKAAEGAAADDAWVANPFLKQGEAPTYEFDIGVKLHAGMPIQDLISTTHEVGIQYKDKATADIALSPAEHFGGNRDYVLKYRLEGGQIESGLMLYEGEEENFFLLMIQPPERVAPEDVPAREFIFIVDVSGSMNGFPLEVSKTLMRELVANLRGIDTFNILLFAGTSALYAPQSVSATTENIEAAIQFIEQQHGSGGTELLPALKRALSLPRIDNTARSLVLVTDGYIDIETECFDLLKRNLGDVNFFAFGIGSSVNQFLIEGLARVGNGEPFIVTRPEAAPVNASLFREYIQTPVLTKIRLDFGNFAVYDTQLPYVPDVLASRPVLVYGKWKGKPQGAITLRGVSGRGEFISKIDVASAIPSKGNSALRYLWARHRIAELGDYNRLRENDERIDEITSLGLTYNLLTQYTSFIAVDDLVRNPNGQVSKVKQPLPLPQGVTDLAVGQTIPTVPEPETYCMLLVGLLLAAVAYMHRAEFRQLEEE